MSEWNLGTFHAHNVVNPNPPHSQRIGDKRTVATPWNRFRAHNRAPLLRELISAIGAALLRSRRSAYSQQSHEMKHCASPCSANRAVHGASPRAFANERSRSSRPATFSTGSPCRTEGCVLIGDAAHVDDTLNTVRTAEDQGMFSRSGSRMHVRHCQMLFHDQALRASITTN